MKRFLAVLPLVALLACDPVVPQDPPPAPAPADTAPEVVVVEPRPHPKKPAPHAEDPGFCQPGAACDTAGDPIKARRVDPSLSRFQITGMKFYAAGDPVSFIMCARDADREPVAGVPATVRVKETARLLAGDGTTLTGADGCVVASGKVTQEDLHPGPGSYIVNGYLGGRLLNTVQVLADSI